MIHRRGFTLIELLVVISIISLLSSVVMASLNTAREKGRMGGIRYFASQIDHIAGEQVVGAWDFNECSGLVAADRSGFGNHGALTNMVGTEWSSDTPSGTGCSLTLDGTNDTVVIPDSSSLDLSGVATLSIWMKTTGSNAYSGLINKTSGLNGYQVGLAASVGIRSDLYNGVTYISPANSKMVQDGNWHHVVVTYDGAIGKVYVDGVAGGGTSGSGFVTTNNTVVTIGNDVCCGGRFFNGKVDDARIFAKTLTASEVNRLYAGYVKNSLIAHE